MIDLADEHYELDISKAERVLSWKPRHSLDKTLPVMIADLKEDPIAWYRKNGLHMPQAMKEKVKKRSCCK